MKTCAVLDAQRQATPETVAAELAAA